MAPRGPRAQSGRAPVGQPGRETRNNTLNTKHVAKSGISKRKGVRTDVDGDLDMTAGTRRSTRNATSSGGQRGAASGRTAPSKGGSRMAQAVQKHIKSNDVDLEASKGSRKSKSTANLSFLRVRGLKESKASKNPDGGLGDLLSFLERKASSLTTGRQRQQVKVKKSRMVGEYVYVGASPQHADEIMRLDSFMFAGAPLEITVSEEGMDGLSKATESPETQQLREKLSSILSQRYIPDNKLLSLSSLAADPELISLGMFENRDRALKTFKGLMAICDSKFKTAKEKRDAIESISVAGNSIDDIAQVENLATTFPQLKNLDLSDNQIADLKALDKWRGKLRDLETMYLKGNPIETSEPSLQNTLLEWFPNLQNINGIQLRTPEQIAAQKAANAPKPIPQTGPDFRDVNKIGENFLLEFFTAYDGDRQALSGRLYDEDSQFSLAVDTHSVREPGAPPPLPWKQYISHSRNLVNITHQHSRIRRLYKGAKAIGELWDKLPKTRHPDIQVDMAKYIMDCHPLPGLVDPSGQNSLGVDGLIVTVHGEFDEHDPVSDSIGKRSFSRVFLLGPGRPGRSQIRVVSDMLSLRAHNPLPNLHGGDTQQTAAPAAQNQAMLEELCKRTGMTPQYSEMCLSQVEWDFEKALAIFEEKKAQLPPEAFAVAVNGA